MELNLNTLLAAFQDSGVARLQESLGLDVGQASRAVEATASSLLEQLPAGAAGLPGLLSSLSSGSAAGRDLLGGLVDPASLASAVAEKAGVGADTASGIVQALLPLLQDTLVQLVPGGAGLSGMLDGLLGD